MGASHYDGETDSTLIVVEAPPMVDRDQLVDALTAAGLRPTGGERRGSELAVTFDGRVEPEDIADIVENHRPTNIDQFDQLVDKARAVWRGEDTFTQAQAQKILAGLVLVVAKYLR